MHLQVICYFCHTDMVASVRQFQEQYGRRKRWRTKIHHPKLSPLQSKGNRRKKEIICGISTYFNPGELTAIMGPSGTPAPTIFLLITLC